MRANRKLLPYDVIRAATEGDVDAMCKVFKHFDGYINSLCVDFVPDKNVNMTVHIDTELRSRLYFRLMKQLRSFRADMVIYPNRKKVTNRNSLPFLLKHKPTD